MLDYLLILSATISLLYLLNRLSYVLLKTRIFGKRRWDLNICCGKTDGGGINADIVRHCPSIKNFRLIRDIYRLPFDKNQFERVVCSHTVEHVDDPKRFDLELRRVGRRVHYIVPPLWDLAAACNFREHKWIFLTLKKEHTKLPPYVRLPLSRTIQKHLEQHITA